MVAIKAVAHFSIPVSDIATSTRFYTEIVGCKHLSTVPRGDMAFLDATATCLILVKRDPPIDPVLDDDGGLDRSSTSHMRGTQRSSTICALMVSRSRSRRTGRAACSTAHVPIFTMPTAGGWRLSI